MTPPSAPYQAFQQAERVAALEAETRAERQYTGAQLVELSTRIGVLRQENKELFGTLDIRMSKFEAQVNSRLLSIEVQITSFINQGRGIGRVAAVIWPVIASVITAILYQFIGSKL